MRIVLVVFTSTYAKPTGPAYTKAIPGIYFPLLCIGEKTS